MGRWVIQYFCIRGGVPEKGGCSSTVTCKEVCLLGVTAEAEEGVICTAKGCMEVLI